MKMIGILEKFMTAFGPSGYEKEIACRFKEEISKTADDVSLDRPGNVIAHYKGRDPEAPVVMLFAHMDQLGFIVRNITADGFVQFDRLGGIAEKVLPGQRVCIAAQDGSLVPAVFGNKSHHASAAEDKYKVDQIADMYLDLGASSMAEVLGYGVDVGVPAIFKPSFETLGNGFVSGTAVDNRGGLSALVRTGEVLAEIPHDCTVYIVGTVWEEFNLRGAMLAARSIQPDIAICIDVVLTGDTPDLSGRYNVACGRGPAVGMYNFHGRGTLNGTIAHSGLVRLAQETANKKGIPLQRFASVGILTDLSYVQLEGKGAACLDLGFPARYTHTPVEVANINDIALTGDLAGHMICSISAGFDLNRY